MQRSRREAQKFMETNYCSTSKCFLFILKSYFKKDQIFISCCLKSYLISKPLSFSLSNINLLLEGITIFTNIFLEKKKYLHSRSFNLILLFFATSKVPKSINNTFYLCFFLSLIGNSQVTASFVFRLWSSLLFYCILGSHYKLCFKLEETAIGWVKNKKQDNVRDPRHFIKNEMISI